MSRYRGPRLRIVRRIGKLPSLTNKTSKKRKSPGQPATSFKRKKKISKYNIRLKEKQKLRFNYGITERQLLNYVKKSRKKKGSSGRFLLTFLEMRLDNIVHRIGFAPTIMAAKQLINHGHICVDDKVINIPSFICQPKSIIKPKKSTVSENVIQKNIESKELLLIPPHLSLNKKNLEAKIIGLINRKAISLIVNELLVIEFYSRKV
uniref:Small ribosomal subunit protein uS4c n=2 Tax=Euglena gracilis TaxID=3039 RepID=RR4_EUGGR|nr:ribosomal protein S4 [Euglena gracilis]P27418.1 RecName: Full=Small ribosomal subunit protein uS4c; AltName: Full=30S ribosomal protein S4, chloroplastic [Euglena gracilis]AKL82403.1 ribosomal protein S4 [Euglena gracilis var. bacillaris]AAA84230.1 ribosomal protein S4 [Euglena gracilis]CAA50134.1 30S ribosomal protein S4 [Euglena gracilis]prf//1718312A ribosomal protein S4 [Euglena gracilis]